MRAEKTAEILSQKQTSPTQKYDCFQADGGDSCITALLGTSSRHFAALDPPDLGLDH